MLFNSYTFLLFFALVLVVQRCLAQWKARRLVLLLASYAFYAAWRVEYLLLIAASSILDWLVARRMSGAAAQPTRRRWLVVSLVGNLGLLALFKYADFLIQSAVGVLGWFQLELHPQRLDLTLPVGISFYTFQTMSYSIDVYRRALTPARSFTDYLLYVAFFPQLVAGPIVRASDFLPQCADPVQPDLDRVASGLALMLAGIWQKTVLADAIFAPVADLVFDQLLVVPCGLAWLGALAFAGQIYCDFAGYSLCAIGAARCLGFTIPPNFRAPYAAVGFTDFWRRWHISLSSWIRDYLYLPLGGNRISGPRTHINLMLAMVLGGLWHGAAWTFVVWGALHGGLLIVERLLRAAFRRPLLGGRAELLPWSLTFAAVLVTWVFFRAETLERAWLLIKAMVTPGPLALTGVSYELVARQAQLGLQPGASVQLAEYQLALATLCAVLLVLGQLVVRQDLSFDATLERMPWWLRGVVLGVAAILLVTVGGESNAFVYFQF